MPALISCLQKITGKDPVTKDPLMDHFVKRGLIAEANKLLRDQDLTVREAEMTVIREARDQAAADATRVEAALKGQPPAKPTTQAAAPRRPVERDQAAAEAFERMRTNPEESLKLSQDIRTHFERVRAETQQMEAELPPVEEVDVSGQVAELEAKETLAQEDLEREREAALQKSSEDISQRYAERILAETDPVKRRDLEREAKSVATVQKRGINNRYAEKRRALTRDFQRQAQMVQIKGREAQLAATKEGARTERELRKIRAFSELNALVSALPPSVREKIGGTVTLAQLRETPQSIGKFMVGRIEKIDKELEKHFQEVYRERIDALLERAKPIAKPGQKPKGKIGIEAHRIVNKINAVTGLSPEDSEAKKASILTQLADAEAGEIDKIAELTEDLQIIEVFGALDQMKDAATLERAYIFLKDVYTTGRSKQKALDAARIANVKAMRDAAKADAGKVGTDAELDARMERDKKLVHQLDGIMPSLLSFENIVQIALGRNSALGKQFVARERAAKMAKRRGILQAHKDVNDLLVRIFPSIKSPLGRERKRWEMQQRELGMTVKKTEGETRLSQMEAIHTSMLWRQDRYKEGMRTHGWTDETMAELETKLTPEAKEIRAFLAAKYQAGHASLNEVFQRMYGMDLPREANYAPGTFEHEGPETDLDPYGHGLIPEGGMAAGFLKARRKHNAMPRIEDALNVFFGHVGQTEHWKAYGELTRDMRSVLKNVEVSRAIKAKAGENLFKTLEGWVTAFERNGIKARSYFPKMDNFFRRFQSVTAKLGLAWNVGTMMKQSSALFSSLADVPAVDYWKGFAKLMAGQLETRKIWNSSAIQDRIASGYSPEARMALESMFNTAPNISGEVVERGMTMIGNIDAFFTTGSAAISYDYHYRQAVKAGANTETAEKLAMTAMEATVARTAQPSEMSDRSLFELGLSPFGRSAFMFLSEARQKLALEYMAARHWWKGEGSAGELAKAVFLMHVLIPLTIQGITSMWRDWRDDDDDEVFDLEHWNPMDFLVAMTVGPLAAIPGVTDMLSVKTWEYPTPIGETVAAVQKIMKDGWPEDTEDQVKLTKKLMSGMSWLLAMLGRPEGELLGVAGKDIQQAYQVIDNFSGDPKD